MRLLLLLSFGLTPALYAQDWGAIATVSSTMGVNGGRICMGESTRGDIGCPTYAPSITTAGGISATGNISAAKFIGDGSLLTGVSAGGNPDNITSGTTTVQTYNNGTVNVSTSTMYLNYGNGQDAALSLGAAPSGNRNAYINLIGDATYTTYGLRLIRGNSGANSSSWLQHRGTGVFYITTEDAAPLAFVTSGTERMRILSSGLVGIGTSSPIGTLDVSGTSNYFRSNATGNAPIISLINSLGGTGGSFGPGYMVSNSVSGVHGYYVGQMQSTASPFVISRESSPFTNYLTLDQSGNLGIGTTAPSTSIHTTGSIRLGNGGETCDANHTGTLRYTSGVFQICDGTGFATIRDTSTTITDASTDRITSNTTSVIAYTGGGTIASTTTFTLSTTGTNDSRLAIGNNTANHNSYIDLLTDATYTTYGLRIIRDNTGANGVSALAHRGTGDFRFQAVDAAPLVFYTTNVERMRIDSAGNIGMGDSTPSYKLDISGTVNVGDGATRGLLWANSSGFRVWNNDNSPLILGTSNTERARIDPSGNMGIGVTTPSDTLHVNGSIRIGNDGSACDANRIGTIRYTSSNFQICDGTGFATLLDTSATISNAVTTDHIVSASSYVYAQSNNNVSISATGVYVNGGNTQDAAVRLGYGSTANHNSYIDLIGDATYTAYGLRIIRNNSGANSTSAIQARGTGGLYLATTENGPVVVQVSSTNRAVFSSSGLTVTGYVSTTGVIDAGGAIYGYQGDSAAAPGYTWSGDTDNGMYYIGTNSFGFSTAGVNRLTLNSSGTIVASNELISTGGGSGQFRMVQGNYGAFFRNDGATLYLLFTASGDQYGSWNTLRPIYFNLASGLTTIGNGLNVTGNLGIGVTTPSTSIHTAGSLRIGNGGEACDANRTGTMRYTAGAFQICDGTGFATIRDTSTTITDASTDRLVSGTTTFLASTGGAVTMSNSANGNTTLYLAAASTSDSMIRLGANRSGNGFAYLDLVGDATYSSYGLRIIRNNAGANTTSQIAARGTGGLYLTTVENGPVYVQVSGTTRGTFSSSGLVVTGYVSTTGVLDAGGAIYGYQGDSAAAPGYTWSGDTDNGMYYVGTNSIGFATGGTNRLIIDSSGHVGINTTTPTGWLNVSGSAYFGGPSSGLGYSVMQPGSATNSGYTEYFTAANVGTGYVGWGTSGGTFNVMPRSGVALVLGASNTEYIRTLTSGNVGLGTTTPQTRLEVNGSIKLSNGGEACDSNRVGTMRYTSGVFQICDGTGFATILDTSATITNSDRITAGTTSLVATTGGTLTATNSANGSSVLYLNTATTSDSIIKMGSGRSGNGYAYIDLIGDATYTSYGLRIIRNNGGANTSSQILSRGTGGLYLDTIDSAPILFYTSSTEAMRIDSAGNVGIGENSPAYKLDISGTANFGDGNARGQIWGDSGGFRIWNKDNSSLIFATNNTSRVTINSAGLTTFVNGVSVTGNISAAKFIGDGSLLTGVTYSESDPQVGTLTASRVCQANAGATAIDCTTAEGSGGGLDADTLDGHDTAYFAYADAATPDQYLSFRVMRNAKSGGDGMFIGYGNTTSASTRIYSGGSTSGYFTSDASGNITRSDGATYWHSGNDGPGSTLNADLLDGNDSTAFVTVAGDTMTGILTISNSTDIATVSGNGTLNLVSGSWKLGIDANELQSSFGGASAALNINKIGGGVNIGSATYSGSDNLNIYTSTIFRNTVNFNGQNVTGLSSLGDLTLFSATPEIKLKDNTNSGAANAQAVVRGYTSNGTLMWTLGDNSTADDLTVKSATGQVSIYTANSLAATFGTDNTLKVLNDIYVQNGTPHMILQDTDNSSLGPAQSYIIGKTSDGSNDWWVGDNDTGSSDLRINANNGAVVIYPNNTLAATFTTAGDLTLVGGITAGAASTFNGASFALPNITSARADDTICWAATGGRIYYTTNAAGCTNTSDIRLKKDITTISSSLAQLTKLRPVTYHWKDEKKDQSLQMGFIAQEVNKVLPQITVAPDKDHEYWGMYNNALIPYIVRGVQELKGLFDTHETRLTKLEQENAELKSSLSQLQQQMQTLTQQVNVLKTKPAIH